MIYASSFVDTPRLNLITNVDLFHPTTTLCTWGSAPNRARNILLYDVRGRGEEKDVRPSVVAQSRFPIPR